MWPGILRACTYFFSTNTMSGVFWTNAAYGGKKNRVCELPRPLRVRWVSFPRKQYTSEQDVRFGDHTIWRGSDGWFVLVNWTTSLANFCSWCKNLTAGFYSASVRCRAVIRIALATWQFHSLMSFTLLFQSLLIFTQSRFFPILSNPMRQPRLRYNRSKLLNSLVIQWSTSTFVLVIYGAKHCN